MSGTWINACIFLCNVHIIERSVFPSVPFTLFLDMKTQSFGTGAHRNRRASPPGSIEETCGCGTEGPGLVTGIGRSDWWLNLMILKVFFFFWAQVFLWASAAFRNSHCLVQVQPCWRSRLPFPGGSQLCPVGSAAGHSAGLGKPSGSWVTGEAMPRCC